MMNASGSNELSLGIVVPCYNSLKTIEMTLHSLLPLRKMGARLIVVDSFSDDGTKEIAARYADEIIDVPAGHMYDAINQGLARMDDCEWLTYINSDDILHADVIRAMISISDSADIIYGDLDFIDDYGRFYSHWKTMKPRGLSHGFSVGVMPILQAGTIFRYDVWKQLGGFSLDYKYSSDYDFFLRALIAGFRFEKVITSPVASFRRHQQQFSNLNKNAMSVEVVKSIQSSGLRPSRYSRCSVMLWRISNAKNYLVRILRLIDLEGRFGLPRSL